MTALGKDITPMNCMDDHQLRNDDANFYNQKP